MGHGQNFASKTSTCFKHGGPWLGAHGWNLVLKCVHVSKVAHFNEPCSHLERHKGYVETCIPLMIYHWKNNYVLHVNISIGRNACMCVTITSWSSLVLANIFVWNLELVRKNKVYVYPWIGFFKIKELVLTSNVWPRGFKIIKLISTIEWSFKHLKIHVKELPLNCWFF
jgi:hypothetical protein